MIQYLHKRLTMNNNINFPQFQPQLSTPEMQEIQRSIENETSHINSLSMRIHRLVTEEDLDSASTTLQSTLDKRNTNTQILHRLNEEHKFTGNQIDRLQFGLHDGFLSQEDYETEVLTQINDANFLEAIRFTGENLNWERDGKIICRLRDLWDAYIVSEEVFNFDEIFSYNDKLKFGYSDEQIEEKRHARAAKIYETPWSSLKLLAARHGNGILRAIPPGMSIATIDILKSLWQERINILKCVSLQEEEEITRNCEKKNVDMDEVRVQLCFDAYPYFLYTDGLGPCVAAFGYCQLENGMSLLGCTHITPGWWNDIQILNELIHKLKTHPLYKGQKIQFYLAGGSCALEPEINREYYKKLCSAVLDQQRSGNLELRGVLFDPYQMNSPIQDAMFGQASLSCSAGITSNGIPLVRKVSDVSFEYNEKNIKRYQE